MNEADTTTAADAFTNETSIEACAVCDAIFDLWCGFGWAISRTANRPEFFCARCYPKVTYATHHYLEWNDAREVRGKLEVGDPETNAVHGRAVSGLDQDAAVHSEGTAGTQVLGVDAGLPHQNEG